MRQLCTGVVIALLAASCTARSEPVDVSTAPTLGVTTTTGATAPETSVAPPTTTLPVLRAAQLPIEDSDFEAVDLPDEVAALNGVMVWTGDELVFWGGEEDLSNGVAAGEPGMAFAPDTGTWRELSPSPLPATYGAATVWAGDEMIVCCGSGSRAAASYDPSSDSWLRLTDVPVSGEYAAAVWTGSEMLVVTNGGVAGYEPSSDSWRTFPGSPESIGRLNRVVWTGSELVVWPSEVERRVHIGMALDPATETWTVLTDPPAWPAAVDIAWIGDQLIIWGGLPASTVGSERAVGSRLDLGANAWTELPEPLPEPAGCECNLGSQSLLWTGTELLVSVGHFGTGVDPSDPLLLAYDPSSDSWSLIGESPAGWGAETLMVGDRVVFRSDRLYLSEPGWIPEGLPIPEGGLPAIQMPDFVDVPELTRVGSGGATLPDGPEITVVATNGQAAISILDLRFGTRADYGSDHTAGGDALDLTMTTRGDLIVWNTGPPQLYESHEPNGGYGLLAELTQLPSLLGTLEGAAYPTDDGTHAWIFSHPTSLEYVETSTGQTAATTEIPAGFQPQFTAGNDLVISDDNLINIVDTQGNITSHGAGEAIEATADVLIWEDCNTVCTLVASPLTGLSEEARIRLPDDAEQWTRAGMVSIPTTSPHLPTITRDGQLLLVDTVSGTGQNAKHQLTIVNLETGTTTIATEYQGPGRASAFWDQKGENIIIATNNNNGQDITIIDTDTLRRRHLPGALPDGYWILAAG